MQERTVLAFIIQIKNNPSPVSLAIYGKQNVPLAYSLVLMQTRTVLACVMQIKNRPSPVSLAIYGKQNVPLAWKRPLGLFLMQARTVLAFIIQIKNNPSPVSLAIYGKRNVPLAWKRPLAFVTPKQDGAHEMCRLPNLPYSGPQPRTQCHTGATSLRKQPSKLPFKLPTPDTGQRTRM